MREIKQLQRRHVNEIVSVMANAYPGMKIVSAEDRRRMAEHTETLNEEPTIQFYGLFEDTDYDEEQLVGVMRFHDFVMQLLSAKTLVGGVGGLAVDLLRKKEKVARDMALYFLRHYRDRGACLTALYPFRPDFYKKMGFGLGAKMNRYRIKPGSIPKGPSKRHVVYLNIGDKEALNDCYNRFLEKTNGLFEKNSLALNRMFESPSAKIVGYKQGTQVLGYLVFTFRPLDEANFLRHDIVVREFIYETPEALWELLTFLRAQTDQVERIEFNTQDESFHHLLPDPRNDSQRLLPVVWHESNAQGVGIMYRVIDVKRLFEVLTEHDFGGVSCRLKLSLADSFLPENAGSTVIHFEKGRPRIVPDGLHDVEVHMDVSEFSSMVIGAITFERLHGYGLARITEESWLEKINRLFKTTQKPTCMTTF
jgi:predicted acetyltransferase